MPLRPMTAADLPVVTALQAAAFAPHTPWAAPELQGELQAPHSRIDLLLSPQKALLGAICYWTVLDEITILNVAIAPAAKRQGHGHRLVQHVIRHARAHRAASIQLEVRRSNTPALALYIRAGFALIRTRRAYYKDGEDALELLLRLTYDRP